ncbi:MAG: hypothetical protein V4503_01595 [Gemmatimonadota bacterium]
MKHERWMIAIIGVIAACASQPAQSKALPETVRPPLRSAQECEGVRAPPGDPKTIAGYEQPQESRMVMPTRLETVPARARNVPITLRLRVNTQGKVDSTVITGVSDSASVRMLRKLVSGYEFLPAVYQQCAVADWTELQMTLH